MAIRQSVAVVTAFFLLTSTVHSVFKGFEGTPEQFPHNVLFKVYMPFEWVNPAPNWVTHDISWGSGSLISNEWVITSCQVLGGTTEKDTITISLGARSREDESEPGRINLKPAKVIDHPNFNHVYHYGHHAHPADYESTYSNDVALVKLSRKVDFSDQIQPVILPKTVDPLEDQVIVTGWGEIRNMGFPRASTWAPYRIVSNPDCEKHYQPGDIFNSTICAISTRDIVIGDGDAGGSLLLKSDTRVLIGVTSFSIRRLDYNPQGFMRITSYLKWIEENTGVTAN